MKMHTTTMVRDQRSGVSASAREAERLAAAARRLGGVPFREEGGPPHAVRAVFGGAAGDPAAVEAFLRAEFPRGFRML